MASVKEQLTRVREVVPHCKKEDIVLILQHFDGDIQKTIQAFMEGTADDILKEWNVPNKRKTNTNMSKKKTKKWNKPTIPQEGGTPVPSTGSTNEVHVAACNDIDKPVGSKKETSHPHSKAVSPDAIPQNENQCMTKSVNTSSSTSGSLQQQKHSSSNSKKGVNQTNIKDNHSGKVSTPLESHQERVYPQSKNPRQGSARANNQHPANKAALGPTHGSKTGNDHQTDQKHDLIGKRERNSSESSIVTDSSKSKKAGATLDKSSKDLQRTVVSLTRHKNLLAEEIEKAEKRLKKAFDDARTSMNAREEDLLKQIQDVKRHATALLEDRQHKAFELKQQISRAPVKSDHDILELRADIKQFVSERKIDEEIGRSSRFTGNLDTLQQSIKSFGEVLGVKHVYSTHHKSMTSAASIESHTRPASISDAQHGLVSISATAHEDSAKTGNDSATLPVTPVSPGSPDIDMDSEVAKLAAKMQRSMQGSRGRGPRKPRQNVKNTQAEQGNNLRQGYSASEGNRQDQRAVRGQQEGKSQNKRLDKKPRNDSGYQGRQKDRPRNDRQPDGNPGDSGRAKEEPKNRSRFNRRREQQRRGQQGPDDGAYKNVKKNSHPMSSPVISDKNTSSITNTSEITKSHSSPAKNMDPDEKTLQNGNKNGVESWHTEALPQRKSFDGHRVKVEVVKDVRSMNGVMNGNPSPLFINGNDKDFLDGKAQPSLISVDEGH